mgnify:CR=1 FL=1
MEYDIQYIKKKFEDILETDDINDNSNFFEKGGDSFDAIRLMSSLDNDLPIITIFENPTPLKLMEYLNGEKVRKFARLIPLKNEKIINHEINNVFIGVPFGGGDPTSYKNIFKDNDDFMVYGVDFGDISSDEEYLEKKFESIIAEINKINSKKIIIYGHCAGASTATYLASKLNKKNIYLIIGASMPVINPDKSLEESRITSNEEWGDYLRSIGGFEGLNDKEISGMLTRGRRDHIISTEMYRILLGDKYDKPVAKILLGDNDPSISHTSKAIDDWKKFLEINEKEIVHEGGHYFLRTHLSEVEKAIYSYIQKDDE